MSSNRYFNTGYIFSYDIPDHVLAAYTNIFLETSACLV